MMNIMNIMKNQGLKMGLNLMKIPAAAVGGVWKTMLRVTIVLAETLRETIESIVVILRELQE